MWQNTGGFRGQASFWQLGPVRKEESLIAGYYADEGEGDDMIDFHAHILPGIDDGSQSMEESLAMFRLEQNQGVETVVATPHFYAWRDSVAGFLRRREKSVRSFLERLPGGEAFPRLCQGAEVYYFSGIGKAEQLSALCIENTSAILLELPFEEWTEKVLEEVRFLVEKRRFTVILAHVERYYAYQKNKAVWNRMLELPLCVQINAASFSERKKQRIVNAFFEQERDVILGSDCHNMGKRPPNLEEGRKMLVQRAGMAALEKTDALGERILAHG